MDRTLTVEPGADLTGRLRAALEESIAVKAALLEEHLETVAAIVARLVSVFRAGGKVVLFGNGGSAAEAQHVAAELVGRFMMEREPLPALALSTDTSILTSIGNDSSFDAVFARQVLALVRPGDLVVAISTSGRSPNVLQGVAAARQRGAAVLALTGEAGGPLRDAADICLCVPSRNTGRVQEANLTLWHAICEIVETELFAR